MHHPHFRRFLTAFLGAAVVIVVALWALIYRGLYLVPVNEAAGLVFYQKEKIRTAPPSDVILVGDSSLGMCIDAAELSRLSGRQCLNLALNGHFGVEGSAEMIKWALDRHPVRKVVVMQTMDMLTRQRREQSFIYVLHRPWSLFSNSFKDSMNNLDALIEVFFSGRLVIQNLGNLIGYRVDALQLSDDYVRQSKVLSLKNAEKDNFDGTVRRDRIAALRRLQDLCRERGVDFIYLHGPIYDDAANENPKLIEKINDALRQDGIPSDYLVERIKYADLGDSIDHVGPEKKDEFTRLYYDRLKVWLEKK